MSFKKIHSHYENVNGFQMAVSQRCLSVAIDMIRNFNTAFPMVILSLPA